MADLREQILSEDYVDYILPIRGAVETFLADTQGLGTQILSPRFGLIHRERSLYGPTTLSVIGYANIPKLFTLLSTTSLEVSGILQVQNQSNLRLTGENVLLGFIDTGIDYTHPAFLDSSGNTRIDFIWDQTIQTGEMDPAFAYGSEYSREMINQALQSEDPYSIVPSRDENGHGTFLAGVAAGTGNPAAQFIGAAPNSRILAVKLKEAKTYLKEFFFITGSAPAYQENDIMMAVNYLISKSRELSLPLVICIGLGTNQGDHAGTTPLELFLNDYRAYNALAIVIAAGNEAGKAHHFSSFIEAGNGYVEAEIMVQEGTDGFTAELWGHPPGTFSIGLVTPLGETVQRIPARLNQYQDINFVLESSRVFINYEIVETSSGEQLILMRFSFPSPGIWRIRIFYDNGTKNKFHIWLPITGFSDPDVVFLRPDPETTVTVPGTSEQMITSATYNATDNSLFINSSRGYTMSGAVKPDLAAPGVDVTGPGPRQGYTTRTGSSVAAAMTAGASALLMEWSTKRNPPRTFHSNEILAYLIRGARRQSGVTYPNREWGYGALDVYGVFETLLTP